MNWIYKNKAFLFLIVWSIIFFSIYLHFNLLVSCPQDDFVLNTNTAPKFASPDEAGNFFWISRFAQAEPIYYFEELNGIGTNLIHLRGMNTIEGKITPGSFLGMTLIYGSIARIFGLGVIPLLTPFFSILGLIFFYLLINYLFKNKSIALISTILLSFFPAWLYYSARGFYHNILFISLLIIGLYCLFKSFNLRKLPITNYQLVTTDSLYLISGFLIGLAIITRTAEIVWLSFTVLLIFILNFKRIHWPGFILFLSGLWLPALLLLYYNQILYGVFISAGYRAIIPAGGVIEAMRSGILFQILITPFGFNLKATLLNAFNYLYQLLPYWSAPAIIGGFLFAILPTHIIKINYKTRIIYLIYFIFITAYLLLFYGSWQFSDRIDRQTLSLGTSYLRYWLPIYILAIPFLATLIWQLVKLITPCHREEPRKKRGDVAIPPQALKTSGLPRPVKAGLKVTGRIGLTAILIILLAMPSFNLVFRKTDESLFLLKNLSENRLKSQLIDEIVNPEDVILIYKQADKIFFPERRKIITELVVPADYQAVARLAKLRNLYYYTFAPPSMVADISAEKFEPFGLRIIEGQKVLGHDWLYKIVISNE
jgi:hypothetical protein